MGDTAGRRRKRAAATRIGALTAALIGPLTIGLVLAAPAQASSHRPVARPAHATHSAHPANPASAASASAATASTAAATAAASAKASGTTTDLAQWCERLGTEVPGLAQPACRTSGLGAGDGRSVHGVPLWTGDVLPAGTPRFRVLLLSGIHGDELASVTLAFDWIARSRAALPAHPLANSSTNPSMPPRSARPTLADVAWRFVPLLNPDGLLHVPSTRVNAHGVDLNRNFPTADWARDAQPYWVKRTRKDPRRFPGTAPLSEPESRWLLRQIDLFHPDLIVSVHAPYGLLDFDGPPPVPRHLGSLELDPVGVYPGSLGNYGGLVKNVPVMTLELKNARQVPAVELAAMWSDLQHWIDQQMTNPGAQANAQKGAAPDLQLLATRKRSQRGRD